LWTRMEEQKTLAGASARLQRALERLEQVSDRLSDKSASVTVDEEIQRMTADRGRLAGELDACMLKAGRLEEANREVSRRLVAAMEAIRQVMEQRRG
jgi:HAMP domain-containing protein